MTWIDERRAPPVDEGPEGGSLEARASFVFKIMATVGFAGVIFSLLPDSLPNSALLTVAFNVSALLISILYVVEARGIDKGRPWALAAVRPLLLLLGAWGAYATLSGLAQGVLRIPFELLLVAWAFLGSMSQLPTPRLADRSVALLGAAIPLVSIMSFGYLVFGWGGLLDVHQDDLTASLTVDCGPPGEPPAELRVAYDWSWSGAAPLPNEVDTVVIAWSGQDADGRELYTAGVIPEGDPTIRSGQRGTLGRELVEAARAGSAGFQWAVDLNRRGYVPGHVELSLQLARENPTGDRTMTVRASYIHLGLWRAEPAPVTCTW